MSDDSGDSLLDTFTDGAIRIAVLADTRLALSMPIEDGIVSAILTIEQARILHKDFGECIELAIIIQEHGGWVHAEGGTA